MTPRITANDYIWLKVTPDVSSFSGQDKQIISGGQTFTADIFETRHIDTQVLIPNAHTLVMGGLVQDNPERPIYQGSHSGRHSRFWASPFAVKTKPWKKTIS